MARLSKCSGRATPLATGGLNFHSRVNGEYRLGITLNNNHITDQFLLHMTTEETHHLLMHMLRETYGRSDKKLAKHLFDMACQLEEGTPMISDAEHVLQFAEGIVQYIELMQAKEKTEGLPELQWVGKG